MLSKLDKYIFSELVVPSGLSFLVLTSVLLLTKILSIAEYILDKNVSFHVVIKILISIFLYLTGITLPLAFLLGIILCFGRLSSESEIIALRTSGISIFKISVPVLFSAILLFFFSLFLSSFILPKVNWSTDKEIRKLVQKPASLLEEKIWMEGFGKSSLYVENLLENNQFKNIVIHQPLEGFTIPRIIMAKNGKYLFDKKNKVVIFTLLNGYIDDPKEGADKSFIRIEFTEYTITLNVLRGKFHDVKKKPVHYTYSELRNKITTTPKDRVDFKVLLFEKHSRISMSFASIVFFMIGFPLSIKFQRSDKSSNLGIGLILIFCWYLLILLGRGMALGGYVSVFIGSWFSNMIIGVIGLCLTLRMAKS